MAGSSPLAWRDASRTASTALRSPSRTPAAARQASAFRPHISLAACAAGSTERPRARVDSIHPSTASSQRSSRAASWARPPVSSATRVRSPPSRAQVSARSRSLAAPTTSPARRFSPARRVRSRAVERGSGLSVAKPWLRAIIAPRKSPRAARISAIFARRLASPDESSRRSAVSAAAVINASARLNSPRWSTTPARPASTDPLSLGSSRSPATLAACSNRRSAMSTSPTCNATPARDASKPASSRVSPAARASIRAS